MVGTKVHLQCQLQGEVVSNAEHSFVPPTPIPACNVMILSRSPSPRHGFITITVLLLLLLSFTVQKGEVVQV